MLIVQHGNSPSKQSTIRTLFKKGYNTSQIAKMLELHRKTVRKC
ncbi:terminase gpP N-terminus-related DNA-binding protein [Clostridium felsineum]